jgi:hypothetical protein
MEHKINKVESVGDEPANNARVRRALGLVKPHLEAYVRQTLAAVPGARVSPTSDVQELLKTMLSHPVHFFAGPTGTTLKNCVHVIREARNRSAHEQPFSDREARHAIDAVGILAESIGAPTSVISSLDALDTPASSGPQTERPVSSPLSSSMKAPKQRGGVDGSAQKSDRVRRGDGGEILNAEELTADDVAMQRVLCPACRHKVFEEWPGGWDAHAGSPTACTGLAAVGAEARKEEFRNRFGQLFRKPVSAAGRSRQRDLMRSLWARFAPDAERVIREYAEAERRGEVTRASNTYGITPEDYARRLLADGSAKGWLTQGAT